jgi:DNA repair protein RecN (Recombination protein N)
MLRFLRVRDLAVFTTTSCELERGLNLITGETGAGKSLLVDAIGLLVGERASADSIRTGEESAVVEGIFELSEGARGRLEDLGYDVEGDELVVRRQIRNGGRGRAFLNDSPATVEALRAVGEELVEIHGQHGHQALLRSEVHRDWLDEVANLGPARGKVARLHRDLSAAEEKLAALRERAGDRSRRLETLEYQISEIEAVDPAPEEAASLRAEAALLANREQVAHLATEAFHCVQEGDEAAARRAGRAAEILEEIAALTGDASLDEARRQSAEAAALLGEAGRSLASFLEMLVADPGRLDAVEDRLARIERLESRHGGSVESVLAFLEEARAERDLLRGEEEGRSGLQGEVESLRAAYAGAAERLRERRLREAPRLAKRVEAELAALAMPGCRFEIRVDAIAGEGTGVLVDGAEVRPHAHGADRVEFLVSPNPGEEPRPLARVASGGELSRIMLALRTSAPECGNGVRTLVFDEVDAGVAGRSAASVAERLASVAERQQVLCVTHLPQVAARASRHLAVAKKTGRGRTHVEVIPVEGNERLGEVARMLGDTPAAMDHARKLLGIRKQKKRARPKGPAGATP